MEAEEAPKAFAVSDHEGLLKWLVDGKITLKSGKSLGEVNTRSRRKDVKPPPVFKIAPRRTRRAKENAKRKIVVKKERVERKPRIKEIREQPDESETTYIEETLDMDEFVGSYEDTEIRLYVNKDPVEEKLETLFCKAEPESPVKVKANQQNNNNDDIYDHIDEDDDEDFHLPPGFEAEEKDDSDYDETDKKSVKLLYCKICSLKFRNAKQLVRHKKKVHTGNKPYNCMHCGTCFADLETLTAHLRRHEGKLPYCCRICKQEFEYLIDFQKHKPVHVLKKIVYKSRRVFTCEVCTKQFRKLCDLERHLRVHTGEKPYSCNVCGNRFQQAHNLRKHLIIHTHERLYECDICKKSFGRSDVLTRHMIIHTVNKPFPCNFCRKSFGRPGQLVSHISRHHPEHFVEEADEPKENPIAEEIMEDFDSDETSELAVD